MIHTPHRPTEWWRDAVIYQIYPRSFASSGGPVGDLRGIIGRLPYLRALGVDAVWLSPFYRSPQNDAGYDVADYRDVDPRFGTLADAEELITRAHALDLKVIVDLVPNHTSSDHPWFQAALASPPGSRERARYYFRESDEIPNDWRSIFGGPAWSRVCDRPDAPGSPWESDRSWYLHLFDTTQPDLNWDNPEVRAEFVSVLRFWLDRGVDGFRVDVAHGLVKDPRLPNWSGDMAMVSGSEALRAPMFDQEGVHEIYREWHRVLAEYPGDRALVAEAWVDPLERLARYVRPDEMSQAFNFAFLLTPWQVPALTEIIAASYAANDAVGAPTTWVLSNHDVVRHASRMGYDPVTKRGEGIGADDPQPDAAKGLRRARAATLLMLGLPGSAYLYQGEELGLPEHTTLPDSVREDPAYFKMPAGFKGRDGCRVPLPWEAHSPGFGFSPDGATWLPQPPEWAELAADAQAGRQDSTLELYRAALRLRREWGLGLAGLEADPELTSDAAAAYRSVAAGRPDLRLALAMTGSVALPEGATVLISSGPLDTSEHGATVLPAETAAWFLTD